MHFQIQGTQYPLGKLLGRLLRPGNAGGLGADVEGCFTGRDLMRWLRSEFAIPDPEVAVAVAQQLFDQEVFHAVVNAGAGDAFEDSDVLYRLQARESTGALNTMQVW